MSKLSAHRICLEIILFSKNYNIIKTGFRKGFFGGFSCKTKYLSEKEDLLTYTLSMYLLHPDLPKVPSYCECERISIKYAREKYPFLFAENNNE